MDAKRYEKKYQELKKQFLICAPDAYNQKGIIFDGVVCPKTYFKQPVKIMVVLAEHYGWDTWDTFHISNQLEDDFIGIENHKVKTPRRILSLIWLLLKSVDMRRKINYEKMPNLLSVSIETTIELNSIFQRICYVNTRKESKAESEGSIKQSYSEIYDAGKRYENILKTQIALANPDLVICCSNPVTDAFIDNCIIELQAENPTEKWKLLPVMNSAAYLFNTSHPSYSKDWGYDSIYESFEILWKHFKNKT